MYDPNKHQPQYVQQPQYAQQQPQYGGVTVPQPQPVYQQHIQQPVVGTPVYMPEPPITAEERRRARLRWMGAAMTCVIFGGLFFALVVFASHHITDGVPDSCCLPQGCDVSVLNKPGYIAPGNVGGRCQFTKADIELMGCGASFDQTNVCTRSETMDSKMNHSDPWWIHIDSTFGYDNNPCFRRPAQANIVGIMIAGGCAAIAFLFAGLLFFCLAGSTACTAERSGNGLACCYTIFIGKFFFISTIGSIITLACAIGLQEVMDTPFATETTCKVGSDNKCKLNQHGYMWTGSECPVKGSPVDVFYWVHPNHQLRLIAGGSIAISSVLIFISGVLMLLLLHRLCCYKRRTQHAMPAADGVAAAPLVQGQVAH